MEIRRFRSPYSHWVTGFLFELVVFAAFLLLLMLVSALIAWL